LFPVGAEKLNDVGGLSWTKAGRRRVAVGRSIWRLARRAAIGGRRAGPRRGRGPGGDHWAAV